MRLNRHSPTYDNILTLAAYGYTIFTTGEYAKDPDANYTASGAVPWWSWVIAGVQLLAGFIMLFTPLGGIGVGLLLSGALGMIGNIFGSQLASGLGMAGSGLQSVITGATLLFGACNPVSLILGMVGIVAGVSTMVFASAEIQEGLGAGNWLKDSGMSEGLYNGVMWASYGISTFVSIVGPIANKYGPKCFAAGTLVLTAGGYKKIEEIEVGDKVLAYDEETGKQGYKEVVRLFRNTTEEWYHIHVNGEDIKCTGGHPFYVASHERFIPAEKLEVGNTLLLSTGVCGIIERIELERVSEPETTYNFEVADFHTYYVGENGLLVHNTCWGTERKRYWKSQGQKYKNSINSDAFSDSGTYKLSEKNIDQMLRGNAPKGIDNRSVHLHHVVGKKVDMYNFVEITHTDHYRNFKMLHPWLYGG